MVIDYSGMTFAYAARNITLGEIAAGRIWGDREVFITRKRLHFLMVSYPSLLPEIAYHNEDMLEGQW